MNDQTTDTDRIAEIRARFDASERALRGQEQAVGRTAPSGILRVSDDIAWLLARVEELQGQLDTATVADDRMADYARDLRKKGVPVSEIRTSLVIPSGKRKGQHPSLASVYRILAEDAPAQS